MTTQPPGAWRPSRTLDALGKKCPLPIIMLADRIRDVPIGQTIEVLADVFGEKPENQIAALLKQGVFTTISSIGVRVAQMLATVQFDGDSGRRTKQINLHATPAIE